MGCRPTNEENLYHGQKMGLPETCKSGVYNAVLVTIEERPGATVEMFGEFLRKHSVPNTQIEVVREPYNEKPGYHYHGVILREQKFKVGRWLTAANKTEEFKGMQFNYWPNTRKLCGSGFAAKAKYCVNYLRDPSKNKITGEVHVVPDSMKEKLEAEYQQRVRQHQLEYGEWLSGYHYAHTGELCWCSGGEVMAGHPDGHHDGPLGNTRDIIERNNERWREHYDDIAYEGSECHVGQKYVRKWF